MKNAVTDLSPSTRPLPEPSSPRQYEAEVHLWRVIRRAVKTAHYVLKTSNLDTASATERERAVAKAEPVHAACRPIERAVESWLDDNADGGPRRAHDRAIRHPDGKACFFEEEIAAGKLPLPITFATDRAGRLRCGSGAGSHRHSCLRSREVA